MALEMTRENFKAEVQLAQGKVLVDFWAPWCAPCRMLTPVIEELSEELNGRVKVGKVNIDEQPELASQFGVMSIPTLIAFKDGQAVEQMVGVQARAAILHMLGES